MSDTVQKLLRQRADGAGPALLAGDQQWSWREYVEESSRRVLNTTRRGEGLARDARHADCQIILTDTGHRPLLDGLDLGGARVLDVDGPEWKQALADVDPRAAVTAEVGPADLFMLIFTSGTSGEPKAVLVTHEKVAHPGAYLSQMLGLTADDRFYLAMPMFHSNAVMAGWGPAVACGGAMALAPRFSARGFIDDVRRYGATYMNYVGKPLAYVLVNTSGAGQFAGYYKDEAATAARIRGGMYWSGDLADRDEAGWVYFAGRTSDWLRVDGETSPLPLSSGSCFAIRT